jgi:DNA-binding Xre family transcriptional regulator
VSARARVPKIGYRWHLRIRMAERAMFATSDLVALLAARGVVLSREQVYRLVAKVPERLSLTTLAALCDVLDCGPAELIEVVRSESKPSPDKPEATRAAVRDIRPRPARIVPNPKR